MKISTSWDTAGEVKWDDVCNDYKCSVSGGYSGAIKKTYREYPNSQKQRDW